MRMRGGGGGGGGKDLVERKMGGGEGVKRGNRGSERCFEDCVVVRP